MDERRESLSYINTAKGIGIILVVLGHTVVPEMRSNSLIAKALYDLIYSFHMPFFFMLSGILFDYHSEKYRIDGIRVFTLTKFKSLMFPYFSFSLVSYLGLGIAFLFPFLNQILTKAGYESFSVPQALFSILTGEAHIDKHIWFCYVLFLIFGISYLLQRCRSRSAVTLSLFVVALITSVFFIGGLSMWVILYRTITMLFFFNVGRFVPQFIILIGQRKWPLPASLLLFLLFYFLYGALPFSPIQALLDILVALSGSALFIIIAVLLDKARIRTLFQHLGKYSYDVYLIHQPFIVSGASGILLAATSLPYPIICAITFLLGIFLPLSISKLVIRRFRLLKLVFLGSETR